VKSWIRPTIGLFIIAFLIAITVWMADATEKKNLVKNVVVATILITPAIFPVVIFFFSPKRTWTKANFKWLNPIIDKTENHQPTRFQFSIARLLIAFAVMAFVLGIFKTILLFDNHPVTILVAVLVAMALSFALLIQRDNEFSILAVAISLYIIISLILGFIIATLYWVRIIYLKII
jgi:MFS family permease